MSVRDFDLIVVGGGTGRDIVLAAEEQGLRVALVEQGPLDGTCHNRGCMPSKMLIHSSDVAEVARTGERFGVETPDGHVDFPAIVSSVFAELDEETREREEALRASERVTFYQTEGRFVGSKTMQVGGETIRAERVVIAAGSRPAVPPIPGLDGVPYITSDEALRLTAQPRHLAIIGGGYVAAELAHFFGALGTEITMLVMGDLLLEREDREIAGWFTREFAAKYRVLLNTLSDGCSRRGVDIEITLKGSGERIVADALLLATGRKPNTDLLDLEETGVELDETRHIKVNEHLRTDVEGIWAFGDIIGVMPLSTSRCDRRST